MKSMERNECRFCKCKSLHLIYKYANNSILTEAAEEQVCKKKNL